MLSKSFSSSLVGLLQLSGLIYPLVLSHVMKLLLHITSLLNELLVAKGHNASAPCCFRADRRGEAFVTGSFDLGVLGAGIATVLCCK
jgi:hypothetical protein